MTGWIKIPFGRELGLDPSEIVLDGHLTQFPPPQKGAEPPQFSAHVYCGQTAEWIEIALGTDVGLGPGHIMLDGDPTFPPPKGHSLQFSAHISWG